MKELVYFGVPTRDQNGVIMTKDQDKIRVAKFLRELKRGGYTTKNGDVSNEKQLIYNDLKQLHKIRHGKSAIEFADFFKITSLQMRTNEEIEKKKFNRSFTQFTFRRRVQKYWNLLPLETRNLGIEGFKTEIKTIMTDDNRARLRQKLLNFGLSQPVELPPAGINES